MTDMRTPERQESENWHPDQSALNTYARMLLLGARDWKEADEGFGATDEHLAHCLDCAEEVTRLQVPIMDIYSYDRRIRQAAEDARELPQPDTAAYEVEAGILSPLGELAETLNLSPQEIQVIEKYAQLASQEARKRKEQELFQNPLLELDSRFAKELAVVEADSEMPAESKKTRILSLELARKALRTTNHNIKAPVDQAVNSAQQSGEQANLSDIVQRLCEEQKQAEGVDGYFYTPLAQGDRLRYEPVMKVLGAEESIQLIRDTASKMKNMEGKTEIHYILLHGLQGVHGEIPHLSKSYNQPYVHFGVTFDQDAVLKIAQSPQLPPI